LSTWSGLPAWHAGYASTTGKGCQPDERPAQRHSHNLPFNALEKSFHRASKNYPVAPKTLDEYFRQKRVDLGLSQRKLAEMLDIRITDTAVEKRES
jgi:hypothetical protein